MKCIVLSLATLLLAGMTVTQAQAQGITADTPLQVASGGLAPGSPTNYDFGDFGEAGKPTLLTNFTVSTVGDTQYPGNGVYTQVIAPDGTGPFFTGIAFTGPLAVQTLQVATFSPTFNGNFTVWVLDANTDGIAVGNASVGLGVNGGAEVSTPTVYNGINEFTPFTVTGATTADIFQVYATTGTDNFASLGGLTFALSSSAATPEPGAFALLATSGLAGMGLLARRRRKASSK